jgi:hypothetical protein
MQKVATRRPWDPFSQIEGALMMILLASDHYPWSRAELQREMSGARGRPVDIDTAIDGLYGAGLIHITGELITPTRSATRMDHVDT